MSFIASVVLLLFFVWGSFTLHWRFRRQEELPPLLEAGTLLGLVLFYAIEIGQIGQWMRSQPLTYVFTVLGLFVAGLALYGHMVISLSSRLIVDIIAPGGESVQDRPRFGPAEVLEKQHDYDGALQEYLVLARIFPRHPQVHQRIAESLIHLARYEEAAHWLERALKYVGSDDKALPILSRLCDVYDRYLKQPEEARKALGAYLDLHPDSEHANTVRERMLSLGEPPPEEHALSLQALDESPLADTPLMDAAPKQTRKTGQPAGQVFTLESMEDVEPLSQEPPKAAPRPKSKNGGGGPSFLEPM